MRGDARTTGVLFCVLFLSWLVAQASTPSLAAEVVHRGHVEEGASRRLPRPTSEIPDHSVEPSPDYLQQAAVLPAQQVQAEKLSDNSVLLEIPPEMRGKVIIFQPTSEGGYRAIVDDGNDATNNQRPYVQGQAQADLQWNPWAGQESLRPTVRLLPDILPAPPSPPPPRYYYPEPRYVPVPHYGGHTYGNACSCRTLIPSAACMAERTSSIYGRSYACRSR